MFPRGDRCSPVREQDLDRGGIAGLQRTIDANRSSSRRKRRAHRCEPADVPSTVGYGRGRARLVITPSKRFFFFKKKRLCNRLHLTFVQDRASRVPVPEGAPRIPGLFVEVQVGSFNLRMVSTSQTVVACRTTNCALSFERLSRTQMTSRQEEGETIGEGKTVLQFALSEYGRLDRRTSSCRNKTHQVSQAVRTMRQPDYYA